MKLSKKFHASLPRYDITRGFKFGELGGHCSFSVIVDSSRAGTVEWLQVTCLKGHLSKMELCRFRNLTLNLTPTLTLTLTLCLYVLDK